MVDDYCFKTRAELASYIVSEIINTTEALAILGCTRQNLNKMIRANKIIPIKEMPRDRLFFKADIMARTKERI